VGKGVGKKEAFGGMGEFIMKKNYEMKNNKKGDGEGKPFT